VILETVGDAAGMGAGIDLECVGDAVRVQDVMQLAGVNPETILVTDIHGNRG
jgi:hypothetical protein